MNAIIPTPKTEITIRPGTLEDVPALDALQKKFSKALGFFPRAQMEGYIKGGWVLVAQDATTNALLGYCASRDRYLKRDELGVIYQLCVAPGSQRGLIGASLVREVFARSAYGCRLYCCWCAKDLEANYFWESMGFVPIAFRAGSAKKSRVHIFWQKRIVENDVETNWWYPSKTDQGAIREDRLVFPIPPDVSWKDVEAVASPASETPRLEGPKTPKARVQKPVVTNSVGFGFLSFATPEPKTEAKPKKEKVVREKKTVDPKFVQAARELRDRWMEKVNAEPALIGSSTSSAAKYDITRAIASRPIDQPAFGAPSRPALAA